MRCIPNELGDDLFVERASELDSRDERRHARNRTSAPSLT